MRHMGKYLPMNNLLAQTEGPSRQTLRLLEEEEKVVIDTSVEKCDWTCFKKTGFSLTEMTTGASWFKIHRRVEGILFSNLVTAISMLVEMNYKQDLKGKVGNLYGTE